MDELDMDFDLDGLNLDDGNWETLIEEIIKGNVIPVIGSGILTDGKDINQMFIDKLADKFGITSRPTSFSQLVYNPVFEQKENIYPWLCRLVEMATPTALTPSTILRRILSIKQFPFVITTSFFPVVERAMSEIWKDRRVKVMAFSNDPSTLKKGFCDLSEEREIKDPTVYYMFGRVCKTPHKFAVTDADMLSFCKGWLSDGKRPAILSKILKNKYLLVFGSNYSDWLFRFIWYSINQDEQSQTNSFVPSPGMVVEQKADQALLDFLKRVDTFTQKDPEYVINTIERKLSEREEEILSRKFETPEKGTDIFLSYSRNDEKYAELLYETLTRKGLNVWYDRQKIHTGANWLEEIQNAIDTTKYFIQIVTPKSIQLGNEFHVYTQERKMALSHADGFERDFFIPLMHSAVSPDDPGLPRQMRMLHAACFNEEGDFEEFATEMLNKINALNES